MSHSTLHLCTPSSAGPKPRPWSDLASEIAALDAPTGWVELVGPDPTASPDVATACSALTARGFRVRLVIPRQAAARDLSALGTNLIAIVAVMQPSSWTFDGAHMAPRRLEWWIPLDQEGCAAAIHCATCAEVPAIVALQPPQTGGLPALSDLRASLDHLLGWAATHNIPIDSKRARGVPPLLPSPSQGSPVDLTANHARLLRDGLPFSGRNHGVRLGDANEDTLAPLGGREHAGHFLAAIGVPALDLPPHAGGPGRGHPDDLPAWSPSPGPRILVLNPPSHDKVGALSTLPALVGALRALGAPAELHSAWPARYNDGFDPAIGDAKVEAFAQEAAFYDTLPARAFDLVVAPGWTCAARVLPLLPTTTRLLVVDMHHLNGITAWQAAAPDFPSTRVTVHSAFPGYAQGLVSHGIPLKNVYFRPYPLDLDLFTPGPPPTTSTYWFSGGNQQRDMVTLQRALAHQDGPTVHWRSRHVMPQPAHERLVTFPTTDLLGFYQHLRDSRGVVLPLRHDPFGASGLTVLAMALAAHRPIVATCTPGTRDHLLAGAAGMLVPEARPLVLNASLRAVDTEEALEQWRTAAAKASRRLDVRQWAKEILWGPPPRRVRGGGQTPWRAW
ncbi:MAG: glycosyltransferase [Myxococcota bacterium]